MALDQNLILYDIPDLEVALSTADPLVAEKQVIYVGTFKKWLDDKQFLSFDVDEKLIDHWVSTHKELLAAGLDVPLPVKHTDDPEKRRGTVLDLKKKVDSKGRISLYASVRFNSEKIKNDLKSSNVSLYCPPVVRHQDKIFTRPIRHVCITDYPVVGDLEPFTIAAAYDNPSAAKPKPKQGNSAMMKALAAKLGLEVPPDASDDAIAGMIFAKFEELMNKDINGDGKVGDAAGGDTPSGDTPTKDTAVAASTKPDPMLLSLVRDNRSMKIDSLVAACKLTPARAKELKAKYTGETISLSNEVFDEIVNEIQSREPIVALSGETSGSQHTPSSESSLVKNALARSGK